MKLSNYLFIFLAIVATAFNSNAQIGYQVTLLNSSSGEPRALETINVNVVIEDSKGNVVLDTTLKETSNEFGILSLMVGDENTFSKVDWSNLPLFISASVDGVMLGKTQILNVPVAEYAKKVGGSLTKEMLISNEWTRKTDDMIIDYDEGGICTEWIDYKYVFGNNNEYYSETISHHLWSNYGDITSMETAEGTYYIYGDLLIMNSTVGGYYNPETKQLTVQRIIKQF